LASNVEWKHKIVPGSAESNDVLLNQLLVLFAGCWLTLYVLLEESALCSQPGAAASKHLPCRLALPLMGQRQSLLPA